MVDRRFALALIACSAVVAAPAAAAPARTAKGSDYAKKVKKLLRARLSTDQLTIVKCPLRVKVRTGYTFTCSSSFTTGDRPNLRVRIRNKSGNFTVAPTTLAMRHLEDRLGILLSHDNLTGDITCPAARRTRRGDRFVCTVRFSNGATGEFTCTQIGDGRVTETYRTTSGDPEPSANDPRGR